MLISLRQLLDHAADNGYGVPAFNVNNMEQILSIMRAADKTDSPVILQASRGARGYAGDDFLKHLIMAAEETYPRIPICMHLDHGNNVETCMSAVAKNFTSVMMDGSLKEDAKTPSDYAYNAGITREVVDAAHPLGVSVEGEIGCLGSLETGQGEAEDGHGFEGSLDKERLLTDPDEAEKFVRETQVDALAVAIGTSHGAYKFTRKPDREILSMETVKNIHARLPKIHLVMHGSSSVPRELLDVINEHGGAIKETWGVPVEEIQEGIRHGVRKINIDTDCRLAITGAVRKFLAHNGSEFDPRKYLIPSMTALTELCVKRYEDFGAAGQAGRIKPVPLEEMARAYASGTLNH